MLLIRRSQRANNAVRTVSPGGELFVGSVVICMVLAAFGDVVDPTWIGEAGFEFMLFDFGGELSLLAISQWNLLQLLLGGAVLAGGIAFLATAGVAYLKAPRPGPRRASGKVPIQL